MDGRKLRNSTDSVNARRLAVVRAAHTAIYVVMATSVFVVAYGALTGRHGPWLWIAAALVAIEAVVFAAAGMKCPLTAVATRYGAEAKGVGDTFFPERLTRHTLQFFGPLILLAGLGLAARWALHAWT